MSSLIYTALSHADLEWARELHNDPDVLKMLTDPHVVSPHEQLDWFEKLSRSTTSVRLVVWRGKWDRDGLVSKEKVGILRLDSIDRNNHSMCLGLDIHKDYRRQGLAAQAYKDVLKEAFTYQGYNRIWLLVAEYNFGARELYKKLGFVEEGVHRQALCREGKYYNYILMGILKEEARKLYGL